VLAIFAGWNHVIAQILCLGGFVFFFFFGPQNIVGGRALDATTVANSDVATFVVKEMGYCVLGSVPKAPTK
jgi:hypothetical protein